MKSPKFAAFETNFVHKSLYSTCTNILAKVQFLPSQNSDKSIKNDSFRRRNAVAHFSFMLFLLFSYSTRYVDKSF